MRSLSLSTVFIAGLVTEGNCLAVTQPTTRSSRHDRRTFLSNNINAYFAMAIVGTPMVALSEEITDRSTNDRCGRPFAPLEALLPATRLRTWVDEIYALTRELKTVQDPNERFRSVQLVNHNLSNPPKLFRGGKIEKRTSSSTAQLSTGVSTANKDQYQLNRRGLNLGDKMTAMMNQADVERQWGMLQYAESKREESNEMRAAFNFYTRQVTFADDYVLTAPREKRKIMIRNDELPTLTAVIASDLDRRDLYRNQFLTSIDDATAEAAYQVKQQDVAEVDVTDLVDLVIQAHDACDNWFSLIAPKDVEDAREELRLNK